MGWLQSEKTLDMWEIKEFQVSWKWAVETEADI